MKLFHPTMKSVKSVTSKGAYEVDATGHTEVSDELGAHLLKCGFKAVSVKPLFPVAVAAPAAPVVVVPPAPAPVPVEEAKPEPEPVLDDAEAVEAIKKHDPFEGLGEEVLPAAPKTTPPASPSRVEKLKQAHEKAKTTKKK